jgi:hypothetical protein
VPSGEWDKTLLLFDPDLRNVTYLNSLLRLMCSHRAGYGIMGA